MPPKAWTRFCKSGPPTGAENNFCPRRSAANVSRGAQQRVGHGGTQFQEILGRAAEVTTNRISRVAARQESPAREVLRTLVTRFSLLQLRWSKHRISRGAAE